MIKIGYLPEFIRQYEKLPDALKLEIKEKIAQFKDRRNHSQLHVHKLHGRLKDYWSFRVNYRYRVLFAYQNKSKNTAILLSVGDHSIYE